LAVLDENRDVDLVVSDINMPRMDGLSLLAKLQESEEKVSTVIVSAYGDMANIRTAMNRGAFDFLMKPIDFRRSRDSDREDGPPRGSLARRAATTIRG
jgi:adenylate cyclase